VFFLCGPDYPEKPPVFRFESPPAGIPPGMLDANNRIIPEKLKFVEL
jgi:hypothetical protein